MAEVELVLVDDTSRSFDTAPQEVDMGAVKFQGWQIHAVTPVPTDFRGHDVYVVKVNTDLVLRPSASPPRWTEFGFAFEDSGVYVADMVPRTVSLPEPTRSYAVTRHLAFIADPDTSLAVRSGDVVMNGLVVPALTPTVETLGIGSTTVLWRHKGDAEGVPVGSRSGWLVLLVPSGLRELKVQSIAAYALTPYEEMGFSPKGRPASFVVQLPLGRVPEPHSASAEDSGRRQIRLGFALDIEGYSARTGPRQSEVQDRLARLVHQVLHEAGVPDERTDVQPTGDGMNVVLPADMDCIDLLPRLMRGMAGRLARDNSLHADRIRCRMACDIGPVSRSALGFSGPTVVRFCRLVDSRQLREALESNEEADLIVAVSDWLYENVFRPGYATADHSPRDDHAFRDGRQGYPGEGLFGDTAFAQVLAVAKGYQATAWLWSASPAQNALVD
ncbi:hypothetical protein [Streptomyces wuyuanensis]|uniref:hypothetical protein n=1 Tax=Streptomyces wuyuanensis TaxID=1196353 RepID=UPI003D7277DC